MSLDRPRRVTQADIARHAGVSTAVVSLVLNDAANGKVRVAAATQERVRHAMRELGYVPNTAARQLARGKTNVVGVFTYETIFPIGSNNFYHSFLVGVEEAASRLGYNLLLLTGGLDHGIRHIYDHGANRLLAAEGAILLGTNEDREELKRLWQERYPFVFVGRREIEGINIPASAADYAAASEYLMEQFIDAGHRTIALVNGQVMNESGLDRLKGTRAAAAKHPEVTYTEFTNPTDDDIQAWLQDRMSDGCTAIICTNMHLADRLAKTADEMTIRIPADLSIGSLGNADNPWIPNSHITTFAIPQTEMGDVAMQLLVDILNNRDLPPQPVTIPCTYVPGSTLAPPRNTTAWKGGDGLITTHH